MKKYQNNHFESKIIKEEETSSSEDDENAVLLTEDLEKGFLKVLRSLKKKDSKLYKEKIDYFSSKDLENQSGIQQDKKELEALHDFWVKSDINEDEQFLRDYILNKKFLRDDNSFNLEEELQKLSEEEKEEEEQDIFEEKYNCRFENPDKEFLQKYPQTMKKASGDITNSDSFTETKQMSNKTPDKIGKKHINKSEERKSIDDAKFAQKRKTSLTPDVKIKMLKSDVASTTDEANLQNKQTTPEKNISTLVTKDSGKKQKSEGATVTKSNGRKMNLNNINDTNQQKKRSKINTSNTFQKSENKTKIDKANEAHFKTLIKIFNSKNKVNSDKKQQLRKKLDIKQPGVLNKIAKKQKTGKRKLRHRVLKRLAKS